VGPTLFSGTYLNFNQLESVDSTSHWILKVYKQAQTAELLFAYLIHKSTQRFSTCKVAYHFTTECLSYMWF
jgi:hypothetical protein